MDLAEAATFFDTQSFDAYDFDEETWVNSAFTGQLRIADSFVSIWNRPTRKRMLFCAPGEEPTSSVIRLPSTGDIFMVGTLHADSMIETAYRKTYGLHQVAGTAVINRLIPDEDYGIKGWAVNTEIQSTFGDVELRSVDENLDSKISHYGNYFMFLPSDADLQRNDTVSLNLTTYYVVEAYIDSGLTCARVTSNPEERTNFTYTSKGSVTYNTATQTTTSSDTVYNVTGRVVPKVVSEKDNTSIVRNRIRIMVQTSFISFTPKPYDVVTFESKSYKVESVERNAVKDEWYIEAYV